MPADAASEGQPPDDRDGRGDSGEESSSSGEDRSVPFLEELFQGEDGGPAPVRRSS